MGANPATLVALKRPEAVGEACLGVEGDDGGEGSTEVGGMRGLVRVVSIKGVEDDGLYELCGADVSVDPVVGLYNVVVVQPRRRRTVLFEGVSGKGEVVGRMEDDDGVLER